MHLAITVIEVSIRAISSLRDAVAQVCSWGWILTHTREGAFQGSMLCMEHGWQRDTAEKAVTRPILSNSCHEGHPAYVPVCWLRWTGFWANWRVLEGVLASRLYISLGLLWNSEASPCSTPTSWVPLLLPFPFPFQWHDLLAALSDCNAKHCVAFLSSFTDNSVY